ncbi:hypothetical protein [Cupriavidus taiwanensis]|uniref:hypothetical protein n=1 Tax=Cupriavidus taiwanensis TaxID=164546 RepID=UPI0018DBCE06|nr:hypothetical protein [Cupriavidus taiwanensis]
MPIWRVAAISEQPEIYLRRWSVYETERGERHFVGQNMDGGTGRVSSAIASFDASSRTGITHSGRRYILDGCPGTDEEGLYTWAVWKKVNDVKRATNVSGEYWADETKADP